MKFQEMVVEASGLPEWLRTSFVRKDDEVFLPCGVFADEHTAIMCMAYDGVDWVQHKNHAYAPASWLIKEYPHHIKIIQIISSKVRQEAQKLIESNKNSKTHNAK